MKDITLPGSKYILALEDEENQWWLRLRIDSKIEDELPLTHIDLRTIKHNIMELLEMAHLQLNDLQIELIQKELWDFIQELKSQNNEKKRVFGTIEDPRFDDLVTKLNSLEDKIKNLEHTISEKEKLLT